MRAWLIAVALLFGAQAGLAAADHFGRVTFGGLPVPGATVIASQDDRKQATVTDQDGVFHLTLPGEGVWTVRVEMIGFAGLSIAEVATLRGLSTRSINRELLKARALLQELLGDPPNATY